MKKSLDQFDRYQIDLFVAVSVFQSINILSIYDQVMDVWEKDWIRIDFVCFSSSIWSTLKNEKKTKETNNMNKKKQDVEKVRQSTS